MLVESIDPAIRHQLELIVRELSFVFRPITALTLSVLASSLQAAPLTVTKFVAAQEQSIASVHWTRSRIAAAPPIPMPVDRGPPGVDTAAVATAESAKAFMGPPRVEPAGKPEPSAVAIARSAYPEDWAALEREATQASLEDGFSLDGAPDTMAGTPGVYTSWNVNTSSAFWRIYPHIWDGKLTFTTPAGSASCSATAISGNHIVTAAHCVYDTGANRFYGNWAFTPAYRNGVAPYGTFTAQSCSVLTAWVNLSGSFSINTWSRHDVAVCRMGTNSVGQTLNGAVGWAGRYWNAGSEQLVFNSGYPARNYTLALISNGPAQYLRACVAESFLQATETLGSGCNWGPGISGGSWMVGYQPFVVTGAVNSVNSGLFAGQQNLYGARFNSSNIEPLCNASGC